MLLLVIAYLSRPVVANLWSKNQVMNTSFDPFKLVNTYGAFGSVGEGRYEPVVALSDDGKTWREVDLPCKPTSVKRRPCFSAPYHHRLDWNIWFIGFKPHRPDARGPRALALRVPRAAAARRPATRRRGRQMLEEIASAALRVPRQHARRRRAGAAVIPT